MASPLNLADPGRRFLAYLIDGLIIGVFSMIVMGIAMAPFIGGIISSIATDTEPDPALMLGGLGLMLLGSFFLYVAIFFYFAVQHSSRHQATFGKRAMKLYVTDLQGERLSFGKAALRALGRFINGMTMLVGWAMVLFTDKKQGLHDMIASTLVLDGNQEQIHEDDFERL